MTQGGPLLIFWSIGERSRSNNTNADDLDPNDIIFSLFKLSCFQGHSVSQTHVQENETVVLCHIFVLPSHSVHTSLPANCSGKSEVKHRALCVEIANIYIPSKKRNAPLRHSLIIFNRMKAKFCKFHTSYINQSCIDIIKVIWLFITTLALFIT